MKLYEFFNVPVDKKQKYDPHHADISVEEKQKMADEVFWFILDHDELHKEFVLPFIQELKNQITSPNFNKDRFTKMWMPMVSKGCKLFHKKHKLKKNPTDLFDEEMRKGLCKSVGDKFIKEIEDDIYSVKGHKI